MKKFKKKLGYILVASMLLLSSCGDKKENADNAGKNSSGQITASSASEPAGEKYLKYKDMSAEDIVASLTLEQKASQMVLPQVINVNEDMMEKNCYGGVLSKKVPVSSQEWRQLIDGLQEGAVKSEAGIPFIYGQDDVHGVYCVLNAVIFPHNIGMGAANDPELMYQVGRITADEAKICHMLWNYAPCVAQSVDPRWGRTYECYSSDLEMIKELSTSYCKGLLDGGIIVCAKHFLGDGNVSYGSGEKSDVERIIDRGNAELSDEEISKLLEVYQQLVDTGVQTIMISNSALNGIKMHENAEYIQYLKNEMGFKGFVVSDWNSVQNTSPKTYYEQVVTSVNAGIDMFMEVDYFDEVKDIILEAVKEGDISEDRVNDAVTRIIRVKLDAGVMEDPLFEKMTTEQQETGSAEYRAVAEKLVEESLVLIKNEGRVLPLKKGAKVYITGPAADDKVAQCGGWTMEWCGNEESYYDGVTTILKGLEGISADQGIEIITDKSRASEADVVLLVVGEKAYAEWIGDTKDLELCGDLGLEGNAAAIREAESLGKPVVACIVAGRNVIIKDHIDKWDSVVMCYLPGSEGQGVANVLCGLSDFRGRLPMPWYSSIDQIQAGKAWLEKGYGLTYGD